MARWEPPRHALPSYTHALCPQDGWGVRRIIVSPSCLKLWTLWQTTIIAIQLGIALKELKSDLKNSCLSRQPHTQHGPSAVWGGKREPRKWAPPSKEVQISCEGKTGRYERGFMITDWTVIIWKDQTQEMDTTDEGLCIRTNTARSFIQNRK